MLKKGGNRLSATVYGYLLLLLNPLGANNMPLKILGTAEDLRTETPVVYAQIPISEFLDLVGSEFETFTIQRRREKHKAYERMKRDLAAGALLPSITLAVKPERVDLIKPAVEQRNDSMLAELLAEPGGVNILDGLQRTYIIKDLIEERIKFHSSQTLHLEFWLEGNIDHLVYRIIVLNAGQKPMSMRHQVELLFTTLKHRIEQQIPDLSIYTEKDQTRRRRPRKYALDRLASAYQSFLTRSPEVSKENIVAQQLVESEALDASEQQLTSQFNDFIRLLQRYSKLDDEICRLYDEQNEDQEIPTGANWFGSANVMQSFFAAYSQFVTSNKHSERAVAALDKLNADLETSGIGTDPLGLKALRDIERGFNPRKVNVGFATRKLLTNGFKEYLRNGGETPFNDCWKFASE